MDKLNVIDQIAGFVEDRRDAEFEFLRKLVRFDTSIVDHGISGKEGAAQEWISEYLKKLGAKVDVFEPDNELIRSFPGYNAGHKYSGRPNVVGKFWEDQGGRSLLLNGHVDVVPAGDLREWDHDPFSATVQQGSIFGRGVCDMKAGLAAFIQAVECLVEIGFKPGGPLVLESVVDEEGGGNGTLACVARGYKADGAIIGEPTSFRVFVTNRGAWLVKAEIKGRPAHASSKKSGVNAIEKALKVIWALQELEAKWLVSQHHPFLVPSTVNIGRIEGGDGASVVAGECRLFFDVEYLPRVFDEFGGSRRVGKEEIRKEVEDYLVTLCQGDEWLKEHPILLDWFQDTATFETPADHPLVTIVRSECKRFAATDVVSGSAGGCDGVYLSQIAGVPTVLCGPAGSSAHGFNEFVTEQDYLKAIKLYAAAIANWCH